MIGEPSKAVQIAEAGAIAPLITLLGGERGADAQEDAAGALYALADHGSNRLVITEAGGIAPLVALLGSVNVRARHHAEGTLVRLSIESGNRVLIIKQLVSMLDQGGSSSAVQEQAAAALANLARDSEDNCTSIVQAGGIPPLLAMMSSAANCGMESTLEALTLLAAKSKVNQEAIIRERGVQIIVQVLAASSSASATSPTKGTGAETVCALAALALVPLIGIILTAQSRKMPTRKGAADKKQSINTTLDEARAAAEGAITPLTGMLSATSTIMQTNAAAALAALARDCPANQAAIAQSGAIAPLCTLVREGSPETKESCASALWSLSHMNSPIKATVAKLGGIESLIALLVSGGGPISTKNATGALASLSSKHTNNRATITKRLVGLLNARGADRAVRVLGAISHLATDDPATQVATAKAGGIVAALSWLKSMSEECQEAAARALFSLANDNTSTQEMMVNLGVIPALASLVNRSTDAPSPAIISAQEIAAKVLRQLEARQVASGRDGEALSLGESQGGA